eukprot:TRINITY_DN24837_c0_g1_i1.p2 TRINITY_DN24837_c0_g1~~TRINITY_DN24837_c0_g1_i1.p2  ORF type:complete len:113 (-),score=5.04 TRINITY_DN24837_c0_g1_i1:165-473(-)
MWHLVTHSDIGWLAVLILWLANGVVFSGVQFAITIMRMAGKDDDDQGGKRDDIPLRVLEPIRVETTDRPKLLASYIFTKLKQNAPRLRARFVFESGGGPQHP